MTFQCLFYNWFCPLGISPDIPRYLSHESPGYTFKITVMSQVETRVGRVMGGVTDRVQKGQGLTCSVHGCFTLVLQVPTEESINLTHKIVTRL
jgi:hypothetical protein